jgi:glycosyltransferase involved in cell wall biosynthesis/ubiquinone/menaquinone biosynthesis C-methylase UbiE
MHNHDGLESTGERLIPTLNKGFDFFYEHVGRYLFASQLGKDKIILDAASGSGYGSYILSLVGKAKYVYGVDISGEAVKYAIDHYKQEKNNFAIDDIELLNTVKTNSIDLITCFEAIEHLHDQDALLKQVKRVLVKGGILIVSTPNKYTYPDGNQFHTKELYPEQFDALLRRYFKYVSTYQQQFEFSSLIKKQSEQHFDLEEKFIVDKQTLYSPPLNIKNSQYIISVCSDKRISDLQTVSLNSSFINGLDMHHGLVSLSKQFSDLIHEKDKIQSEKNEQLKRLENEKLILEKKNQNLQSIIDNITSAKAFKAWQQYVKIKKLSLKLIKDPKKILKVGKIILKEGPQGIRKKLSMSVVSQIKIDTINLQYQAWFRKHYPSEQELLQQKSDKLAYRPKISIITPVYNTPEKFLRGCLESVINQAYDNWELCIADDASNDGIVREIITEYAKKDNRIKYILREKNGHICEASNSALSLATGEFIGLLDHDDILWPNALYEIAKAINSNKNVDFIYSDEDKLDQDGVTHVDPFFKPGWNPALLRSLNYITHFTVIKKSLVYKIGGFRKRYEGAQDWDLFLRATVEIEKNKTKNKIIHIPNILYSWRKSSLSTSSAEHISNIKKYVVSNQKKVLESDLANRKLEGKIISTEYLGLWRVEYDIIGNPLVSIIIPTRDHYEFIKPCLDSIIEKSTYKNYELVLIDTGSKDKEVWKFYEDIQQRHTQTKILKWNKDFNFSSVCNYGSKNSNGKYLIFLNNDTEIITPLWIEALLEQAQRKEVGAVGLKLLYPNNTIQHAGIVFSPQYTLDELILPSHIYKNFKNNIDYGQLNGSIYGTMNYLAVTGACLMVDSKKFNAMKGMDASYKLAFNDVDLCLRLFKKGYQNVYTSHAALIHHESATMKRPGDSERDMKLFKQELLLLHQKWNMLINNDPYFNNNNTNLF